MIRIDMSEYMEKHTVSRLIGAPPGYVGYDEGGQLYRSSAPPSVQRNFCWTKLKKRMPMYLTYFLQVLDDGRLTDGQGRIVDF